MAATLTGWEILAGLMKAAPGERGVFRSLRRATKGFAFGNHHPLVKGGRKLSFAYGAIGLRGEGCP